MNEIVFKHIRDTTNIGDASCSPYDYVQFENAQALDWDRPTPECDTVIFGGGKIFGGLAKHMDKNVKQAKHRIAWGVSTVQTNPLSYKYWAARKACTLVGTRDYGDKRYEYAPCASCLYDGFDKKHEITNEVVFYAHAGKTQKMGVSIPDNIPTLDNHCGSLEQAIAFIGSGETVVSNSYHGVYWGLLLGRRVLCLPFSNKFSNYRIAPSYATPSNWLDNLKNANHSDELLEISRHVTVQFTDKVKDRIYA